MAPTAERTSAAMSTPTRARARAREMARSRAMWSRRHDESDGRKRSSRSSRSRRGVASAPTEPGARCRLRSAVAAALSLVLAAAALQAPFASAFASASNTAFASARLRASAMTTTTTTTTTAAPKGRQWRWRWRRRDVVLPAHGPVLAAALVGGLGLPASRRRTSTPPARPASLPAAPLGMSLSDDDVGGIDGGSSSDAPLPLPLPLSPGLVAASKTKARAAAAAAVEAEGAPGAADIVSHAFSSVQGTGINGQGAATGASASGSSFPSSTYEPGGPTVIFDDDPPTEVYEKAITRTLQWMSATALFGLALWSAFGASTAEEFFAGYLVEQSLSVDNLFVFLLLFDYFAVPIRAQDRVLNWGIYGAVVMRAVMIGLGAAALENFHAILLLFAAILVYSSAKVLLKPIAANAAQNDDDDDEEEDMSENQIVRFSKSVIDSVDKFDGDRFFTVVDGVRKATPLFICMIAVELSDVIFAVDSIPAVFGVTANPLVVFTSNMFAIMGLRSLYTILSKAASDLEYLEPAVAIVLGFIGAKMIGEYFGYKIATELALAVVATLLGGGVGLSVWSKNRKGEEMIMEKEEEEKVDAE